MSDSDETTEGSESDFAPRKVMKAAYSSATRFRGEQKHVSRTMKKETMAGKAAAVSTAPFVSMDVDEEVGGDDDYDQSITSNSDDDEHVYRVSLLICLL